jgi:hypothetical protein
MGVIKNPRKIFVRSLCVPSRFVALLDEKAGNPSLQPVGRTDAQVHIVFPFFRLSAEGHFDGRSI